MGLVERAGLRYDARMAAYAKARPTVAHTDQVAIPLPAPTVWDFVWRAENSPLLSDHVVEGFTVPGTPVGAVGEVQCHIVKAKGDILLGVLGEVVELDPGRRAVVRSLSSTELVLTVTEVVPAGESACVLRHSLTRTVSDGKERKAKSALVEEVTTYVRRVDEVLRAQFPNRFSPE